MDSHPEYPPHALGRRGEALAAEYLRSRGWIILAQNYRFGRREVDLIARRGCLLAFVEVKTRAGVGFGGPLGAITRLKRREIEIVAEHFLARHAPGAVDVRFDAISVQHVGTRKRLKLEHIEDAWRPGWP